MKQAANHVTDVALELGGKNPNIIFDDADFELAVDQALNGGYFTLVKCACWFKNLSSQ